MIRSVDHRRANHRRNSGQQAQGFTLVELIIVIVLIGVVSALAIMRPSSFAYWKDEGFLRSLSETITFLHHQASVDQAFYRMEFDLEKRDYRIGILKSEDADQELVSFGQDLGALSLELAAFLNPSLGTTQTFIPPPSYPTLAAPVSFPDSIKLDDIRDMRGRHFEGRPYILFSPRGFSEFALIHLRLSSGIKVTVLVNPFTGNTEISRGSEYKDYEWTYKAKKASS